MDVAASVLGILSATVKFAQYLRDVKNAKKELAELEKELSVLASLLYLLGNLGRSLQSTTSVSSESWNHGIRALEADNGPMAQYALALDKLSAKMDSSKKLGSVLVWHFVKEDIMELLDKVERLKATVSMHLNVGQLLGIEELKLLSKKRLGDDRTKDALRWLSMIDSEARQVHLKSLMEKDTGQWFLKSAQFQHWLHQPGPALFCPGIPGAGKTIMVAGVVDHLETYLLPASLKSDTNLAYVYCEYKADSLRPVSELLGEIVRQLVSRNEDLVGPLLLLYDDHVEKRSRPTFDEIYNTLKSILSLQRTVYLVVDALDEIPQENGKRRTFMDTLVRLQAETAGSLRMMVTARPLSDVVSKFKDSPTLEIQAMDEDINKYTTSQFQNFRAPMDDDCKEKVRDCILKTSNGLFLLAHLLLERFVNLHNRKQIKTLINDLSGKLDASRSQQPIDIYKEVYQGTMSRIETQSTQDVDLAKKVLMWITNAARSLTTGELCCALSVEPDATEFDHDNWYSVDLIVAVCAGLVVVDKERNIIQLVHYTAQEYFDALRSEKQAQEIHEELAITCLTYLCLNDFRPAEPADPPRADTAAADDPDDPAPKNCENYGDDGPFRMARWHIHYHGYSDDYYRWHPSRDQTIASQVNSVRLRRMQPQQNSDAGGTDQGPEERYLLDYAANFWAFHYDKTSWRSEAVLAAGLRLACDQQLAAHAFQHATHLYRPWPYLWFSWQKEDGSNRADEEEDDDSANTTTRTRVTGLHLVAAVGLSGLLDELLERIDATPGLNAGARDEGGRTALMWAAHHGHHNIVWTLLERHDVGISVPCCRGDTALHYAARRGWSTVTRYICDKMERRGDVEGAMNSFGETALVQAALEGHAEVVREIRRWEDPDQIYYRSTALGWVNTLHVEVMFGLWPIHLAAQTRPVSTFRLFVEEWGVDVEVKDPKGYNAFMVAVDWGNEGVVRYLLERRRSELITRAAESAAAAVDAVAERLSRSTTLLEADDADDTNADASTIVSSVDTQLAELETEEERLKMFKAAKLAATNWKRLKILQLIVEEAPFVLTLYDPDEDDGNTPTLLAAAVDAANMEAAIYLSSCLLVDEVAVTIAAAEVVTEEKGHVAMESTEILVTSEHAILEAEVVHG
ncbi:hypothetical protein B0H66DRAFT_604082 [Apodospora peruviana]|uniref:Ankyrin repeat protein n=1 Tax=Apodospora peruviana TaxID=516989 RepID=A0AAE0HZY6_9PEZI|nr:hypothetical protein B0H66DRAFT_604082 [Apodospora peruviana]